MHFLAFEGLDGAGKSTLMEGLRTQLKARGIPFVFTREPGGTPLGEEIRTLLLKVEGEAPCARAEALLYQAGRAQHVDTLIRPALAAKKWVISDRFAASSVAFQAGGREIGIDSIRWLNTFSTAALEPDLYVLLDLTVEESLRRLQGRDRESDRFERENREFHERVRQSYLKMALEKRDRWLVLSAAETPERLLQQLIQSLQERQWLD